MPLIELAKIIKKHNIRNWTSERKENLWHSVIHKYNNDSQNIPEELEEVTDEKFKINLSYIRRFWNFAGLNYYDQDYDAVRAGIAILIQKKYL